MGSSGGCSPDPFYLPDVATSNTGYRNTNGRTIRSAAINPAVRNLVLVVAGQSNGMNITPTLFTPTNAAAIDNLNIHDGALYSPDGPMLGAAYTPSTNGPGHVGLRVADLFISNNRFDRVILVPIALSGTPIATWGSGGINEPRVAAAIRRLAARGITPATAGVTFALLWMQGEADGQAGTTSAAYQASWAQIVTNAQAAGFSGRYFVPTETWQAGASVSTIQSAQAAVRNGTTAFDGGNLDSLTATSRQADNTHFNDSGAASAATLIYNAMRASGAPY